MCNLFCINCKSKLVGWFLPHAVYAATPFEFKFGDTIGVTADKSYRDTHANTFEAIGNAVITHGGETIYGEKATLFLNTGVIEVKGNVRYSGPQMIMYGQELTYNVNTAFLAVKNARIISDGYMVVGEYIARVSPTVILADNAEYTTCIDCPESWSIYGKKVRLKIRDYIQIKHALIKSKGVTILYFPYIVFPVKRGRQTGLLMPQITFSLTNGFQYNQPWFWAINDSSDMTVTPGIMGRRGYANQFEYRKMIGESKWLEIHSLNTADKFYIPATKDTRPLDKRTEYSGNTYYRYLTDYEHHFQFGNHFNHHFYTVTAKETDMFGDYSRYAPSRILGSELPLQSFLEYKNSLIDTNIEGYYNRNLLTADPTRFDGRYVQILPKTSFHITPFPLFYTNWPIFKNASLGGDLSYTLYKQMHSDLGYFDNSKNQFIQNQFIRNANRFTFNPYLSCMWGRIGPITMETKAEFQNLYYRFPNEKKEKWFYKRGTKLISDAYFEIEKIFGFAYKEKVPMERVEWMDSASAVKAMCNQCPTCTKCLEQEEMKKEWEAELAKEERERKRPSRNDSNGDGKNNIGAYPGNQSELDGQARLRPRQLIGEIPPLLSVGNEEVEDTHNSYRHSILFNVRHHFTPSNKYSGSGRFAYQISKGEGQFDYLDYIRDTKAMRQGKGPNAILQDIPDINTIEFRILNNLFSKSANPVIDFNKDDRYLTDNFEYGGSIASLNISQGITMDTHEERFIDKLTRLNVNASFPIFNWSLGFNDTYFYSPHIHLFTFGIGRSIGIFTMNLSGTYNPLTTPVNKNWTFRTSASPFQTMSFSFQYDYNITEKHYTNFAYSMMYSPPNRCWKLSLDFSASPNNDGDNKQVALNFYVNFGGNVYTSVLSPGNSVGGGGGV